MTIEYNKVGDYYFPSIKTNEQMQVPLSKYCRMKLRYLKEHQRVLYSNLLTTGELAKYLQLVDQEANELYDKLLVQFKKQRNITEELKETNQMRWVREMNNIQNFIDEIIKNEIIYC